MIISLDLVAGRFLGLISFVQNRVCLGTEMSALAFLARLGAGDNPENTILTCFLHADSGGREKAPPKVLLWRGLETFSVRARIVSLAVSVSFSFLPFSLRPLSVSSVNDFPLQGG